MIIRVNTVVLFFIFSSCLITQAFARQAYEDVVFLENTYDFGEIKDSNERVEHIFRFVNQGNSKLLIQDVKPSCGCLVTDWSREKILPGDTGKVNLVFNPYNRPGPFSKFADITFSDGRKEQIMVTGSVVYTLETEQEYPYSFGPVRAEKRRFPINEAEAGSMKMVEFRFMNESGDTLRYVNQSVETVGRFVYKPDKYLIPPGERFQINGIITLPEMPGYYEFGQQIILEGTEAYPVTFDIVANVIRRDSPESGSMGEEASILFDKSISDVGKVVNGTIAETSFLITNNGFDLLEIDNVVANCSCLKTDWQQNAVTPGETIELKVMLETSELKGVQQKALHLYSNAGNGKLQQLMIKINVVEE